MRHNKPLHSDGNSAAAFGYLNVIERILKAGGPIDAKKGEWQTEFGPAFEAPTKKEKVALSTCVRRR